jgi:prolyl oligopeptidase
MKLRIYSLFAGGLFLASCGTGTPDESVSTVELTYPEARKDQVVEDYFGKKVEDPYRWLEDDLSDETAAWVEAENKVTRAFIDQIPFRDKLRNRLEELWNYEKVGSPFIEGEYTYFYKNDGLQNQYVIYRSKGEEEPQVFLDPNTFSKDGTTSLGGISFTEDGSLIAYQISEGGSDWRKVIVMRCSDMKIIEDTLVDVKFSGLSWKGNEGFYYSSYDKPKEGSELSGMTQYHKLFYHKLGTSQKEDVLVFGGEEMPRRYVQAYMSRDERYLIISAANSTTGNEFYVQDMKNPSAGIQLIIDNFDNEYGVIHTEGDKLYIQTNYGAPNNRIMVMDINSPNIDSWTELIAETEMPLNAGTGCGKIFCSYLKDATTQVKQYSLSGEMEREIELPGVGSAGGFGAKWEDEYLYYSFTNYIQPGSIYIYHPESGESELYRRPDISFDPSQFESKQIFYTSKDGTKIPMIISHKKGVELNGQNPTMLYGYGGFNISLTPSFSISNVVWMENGGVYAVANLRGGGEYGEEWHNAGTQMNKQNVFDDFISAAEYLIAEGYTSSEKLAIAGGSNGGLLVGACMTQRPELFQVALPAVGVLDMLRYHKFTAGAGWAYDYGTSDDSKEMFEYLYGYSPYHNLKDGTSYPATMVTTGDHDDRVVPAHSFKFAARLQEAHKGSDPVLIRIETKAGHGAGKPTSMIIDEQADKWAFTFYNMGINELPQ